MSSCLRTQCCLCVLRWVCILTATCVRRLIWHALQTPHDIAHDPTTQKHPLTHARLCLCVRERYQGKASVQRWPLTHLLRCSIEPLTDEREDGEREKRTDLQWLNRQRCSHWFGPVVMDWISRSNTQVASIFRSIIFLIVDLQTCVFVSLCLLLVLFEFCFSIL